MSFHKEKAIGETWLDLVLSSRLTSLDKDGTSPYLDVPQVTRVVLFLPYDPFHVREVEWSGGRSTRTDVTCPGTWRVPRLRVGTQNLSTDRCVTEIYVWSTKRTTSSSRLIGK